MHPKTSVDKNLRKYNEIEKTLNKFNIEDSGGRFLKILFRNL
jgi:hypothetical protein